MENYSWFEDVEYQTSVLDAGSLGRKLNADTAKNTLEWTDRVNQTFLISICMCSPLRTPI